MPKPSGMRNHLATHEQDALYAVQHGAITREMVCHVISQAGGRREDVEYAAMGLAALVSLGYLRSDQYGFYVQTDKGRANVIPALRFAARGGR